MDNKCVLVTENCEEPVGVPIEESVPLCKYGSWLSMNCEPHTLSLMTRLQRCVSGEMTLVRSELSLVV